MAARINGKSSVRHVAVGQWLVRNVIVHDKFFRQVKFISITVVYCFPQLIRDRPLNGDICRRIRIRTVVFVKWFSFFIRQFHIS